MITNACFDLDFTEDGECDDSSMMCDIVADEEQEIIGQIFEQGKRVSR